MVYAISSAREPLERLVSEKRGKMKVLAHLLTAAAILFATAVHADSKLTGDTDPGTPFPDKSTVQKNGPLARIVVLYIYRHMKSGTVYHSGKNEVFYFGSTKVKFEFDCPKHRSRVLQTVFFSDQEGKGNVVHNQTAAGNWAFEPDYKNPLGAFSIACRASAEH